MYTQADIPEFFLAFPLGVALLCMMLSFAYDILFNSVKWGVDDFGELMMMVAFIAIGVPLMLSIIALAVLLIGIGILPGGFR